jgi:hypothetical protein
MHFPLRPEHSFNELIMENLAVFLLDFGSNGDLARSFGRQLITVGVNGGMKRATFFSGFSI